MRRSTFALFGLCAAVLLLTACATLTPAQVQAVDDSTAWADAVAAQAAAGKLTPDQATGALAKQAATWHQMQAAVHHTTVPTPAK